jgi:hypothetical protein
VEGRHGGGGGVDARIELYLQRATLCFPAHGGDLHLNAVSDGVVMGHGDLWSPHAASRWASSSTTHLARGITRLPLRADEWNF